MKIISGGQTGADQAALDAAIHLGLPYGGWLPRGRKTEAGPLPQTYRLKELHSAKYRDRTQKNIKESDGTLIVSFGPLSGGSALTEALAIRYDRPCLHLDLTLMDQPMAVTTIKKWLDEYRIETLNVAGSRASGEPRLYRAVFELLTAVQWEDGQGQ
ncbi:MAG: putative molybdenum carrier protein [Desulfobulbaceae bacterium]|nr:putative molybdenum carrier protein [Desulfobulbaceae bacterium]